MEARPGMWLQNPKPRLVVRLAAKKKIYIYIYMAESFRCVVAESFRYSVGIVCFYEINHKRHWILLHLRLERGAPRSLGFPWRVSEMLGFTIFGNCERGISQEELTFHKNDSLKCHILEYFCSWAQTQNCHIIPEGLLHVYIYIHTLWN